VLSTWHVLQVHIYHVPGLSPISTTEAALAQAQTMFPQGQQLAVIEPYYKLMLDGTYGIRVDKPNEVRASTSGWLWPRGRLLGTGDNDPWPSLSTVLVCALTLHCRMAVNHHHQCTLCDRIHHV
jgi:hypothetical protein